MLYSSTYYEMLACGFPPHAVIVRFRAAKRPPLWHTVQILQNGTSRPGRGGSIFGSSTFMQRTV